MRETAFQRELAETFRRAGWWVRKWPDMPAGQMDSAPGGKLRFNLPRPFDLVMRSPYGGFGAIECKMARGPSLKVDERFHRQIKELATLAVGASQIYLAVNFRYTRKRTGKTNRAFLLRIGPRNVLPLPGLGDQITTTVCCLVDWVELKRITGGWK